MKSRILRRSLLLVPTLVGAAMSIAIPNTARAAAANGGQPLPWEGPLNQVLASFTGPVAKVHVHPGHRGHRIWFRVQRRRRLRRFLGLLLGVSIAVTATSFGVTFFGLMVRGGNDSTRSPPVQSPSRRMAMSRPEEIEGYEVPLHVATDPTDPHGRCAVDICHSQRHCRPGDRNGFASVVAWIPGGRGSAYGGGADEQTRSALV